MPLSKSKTTVGNHQLANGTSNLQSTTPSQGIKSIFADPNYGIGGAQAQGEPLSQTKSAVTTVVSRHLHSPRKANEDDMNWFQQHS